MTRAVWVLLAFISLCAQASVIYDFSGTVDMFGIQQLFRYTAPDFITADTFVPAAALDSTGC